MTATSTPGLLLLKHASVLAGPDLEYLPDANIVVADGRFSSVNPVHGHDAERDMGPAACISDCSGLLVIPGLINCHTHIGDSVGKDARLTGTVDDKIHPVFGLKPRILSKTPPAVLAGFMRNSCTSMLRGGTTTFVDFREGGVAGVRMLKQVLADLPIRGIVMGRADHYQDDAAIRSNAPLPAHQSAELGRIAQECDGFGISGANENSDAVLGEYSGYDTLRAIHASETQESVLRSEQATGTSETVRALALKPHFLVHMTYASASDLAAVAASGVRGIVACPRANSSLAEGLPDIMGMGQKSGRKMALGTDNVMVNAPDMFREMEYAWKTAMGMHKKEVPPAEILKMATVNAGMILGQDIGQIARGMLADCVFVDKHSVDIEPMHSPHAAIVHRASASSVRAVMIGGRIAYGAIPG